MLAQRALKVIRSCSKADHIIMAFEYANLAVKKMEPGLITDRDRDKLDLCYSLEEELMKKFREFKIPTKGLELGIQEEEKIMELTLDQDKIESQFLS